jgi:hypothetical protein
LKSDKGLHFNAKKKNLPAILDWTQARFTTRVKALFLSRWAEFALGWASGNVEMTSFSAGTLGVPPRLNEHRGFSSLPVLVIF